MSRRFRETPTSPPGSVLPEDPPGDALGGRARFPRACWPGWPWPATSSAVAGFIAADGTKQRLRQSATPPRSRCSRAPGQERHLPLHVRRPQPDRHLRLQARALQGHRRQDHHPSRPSAAAATRTPAGVVEPQVEVQAVRPVGQVRQRTLPQPGHGCVDDIAFLHSMTADSPIHGSAMLQMNTGEILSGSRAWGRGSSTAWGA